FIGTGVAVACLIDIIRLYEYGTASLSTAIQNNYYMILFAVIAAFSGSYIGVRLVKKVTIKSFQLSVSIMLFVIADLMILGII
ncbi:MAG: hypothetical protein Q8Q47_11695, partial [Ignavibacteriaceae bacterium]|nr:hypothetical protein [Ignavibacteriaceae bacterium]